MARSRRCGSCARARAAGFRPLELVSTKVASTGVLICAYKPVRR